MWRPDGRDRVRAAQDAVCGGEEITITYGFWDDVQRPAVEQQIAAFKELHPNITVEPQVVPWDDYWTKLQTGVAGGSTYDVFWMNADGLPVYASQGALVSIQEMVDDGSIDADAYPESLRSLYTFEDTVYGIPRDFDTIALFYNKDLFDNGRRRVPDRRLDLGRSARRRREADHRRRLPMGLRLIARRAAELLQPDQAERGRNPQRRADRVDAQ